MKFQNVHAFAFNYVISAVDYVLISDFGCSDRDEGTILQYALDQNPSNFFRLVDAGTRQLVLDGKLTHICLVELSILMNWTSSFPILGVSGVLFHFYSVSNRYSCKQTVKTLIRRRVLRRLIWVCTVCLCPKNEMVGLYGLKAIILQLLLYSFTYVWYVFKKTMYRARQLDRMRVRLVCGR